MLKWKDTSSYAKGDTDRNPNSWISKAGKVSICMHRHIHYPGDTWLVSCAPFFDKKVLVSKDADEAKAEAIGLVRVELKAASEAIGV